MRTRGAGSGGRSSRGARATRRAAHHLRPLRAGWSRMFTVLAPPSRRIVPAVVGEPRQSCSATPCAGKAGQYCEPIDHPLLNHGDSADSAVFCAGCEYSPCPTGRRRYTYQRRCAFEDIITPRQTPLALANCFQAAAASALSVETRAKGITVLRPWPLVLGIFGLTVKPSSCGSTPGGFGEPDSGQRSTLPCARCDSPSSRLAKPPSARFRLGEARLRSRNASILHPYLTATRHRTANFRNNSCSHSFYYQKEYHNLTDAYQ